MPATVIPEFKLRHRLVLARESAGFTKQQELADAMEVARTTISNYEAGVTKRHSRIILRTWAEVCGVPFSWLVEGTRAALETSPNPHDARVAESPARATKHRKVSADTLAVTEGYQWRPRLTHPHTRNVSTKCYTKEVV